MKTIGPAVLAAWMIAGAAAAQEPTATDLLAGAKWGWLGFEHDASKIGKDERAAMAAASCRKPNISFRMSGARLVLLDHVVAPPSVTVYERATVTRNKDQIAIDGYLAPDSQTPSGIFKLWDNGAMLTKDGGMFGDWHYARCPELGEKTYDAPAPRPTRGGR